MKKSKMQKVKNALTILFLVITVFLFALLMFLQEKYANITSEELIFYMNVSLDGANTPFIPDFFRTEKYILIFGTLFVIFMYVCIMKMFDKSFIINLKWKIGEKSKEKRILIKNAVRYLFILPILIIIYILLMTIHQIKFDEYLYNINHPTDIYEKYYVNPKTAKMKFPEKKRNLIYLYLESMESTYANIPGELSSVNNLIPNLDKIAKENVNFSDTTSLGGAHQTANVTWTVAGMVAQSGGIPLSIPSVYGNSMDKSKAFLSGSYMLGDVLEKEGYNQMFMMGSDSNFGGRLGLLTQHGNYQIYDLNTAREKNKIADDYFVWWGFEDGKLFEYAKEELTNLASQDQPFNFQLLTVNTHFDTGYNEAACEMKSDNVFGNSVLCSDKQIGEFIRWIQQQDFYEDTTIVLSGDHLLMGETLYQGQYNPDDRRVYNAFINPAVTPSKTKNRTFTTLDMYPSTLASMGVEIKGDRLALGTNLFSSKKTLAEEMGIEKLTEELRKRSEFYNEKILYPKQDDKKTK